MQPKVKYCGTWADYSGYGSANRNFITALFLAEVDVTTELVVQVPEKAEYGLSEQLAKELKDRKTDYKIKIIHLTPDMYPTYMEKGIYHIGHLFWETDKLPKEWVEACNKMNEIWTASEAQANMIKNSGVNCTVKWFPQPIDTIFSVTKSEPYIIPFFKGFAFYSIFQWIERKNPRSLLRTYWKTFQGKDDVILILKTYGNNYSQAQIDDIKKTIKEWKQELQLTHFPRIFLVPKLMDTIELFRLHKTGECLVSTTRGEGWGIPIVEACLSGNPVISIDKTGVFDYLPKDLYYQCSTKEEEVSEVPSIKWYKQDQKWLQISEDELSKQMMMVYKNYDKAKEVGLKAKEFVQDNFNFWNVGRMMKNRLQEIQDGL